MLTIDRIASVDRPTRPSGLVWCDIARQVHDGTHNDRATGLAVLQSSDDELLSLLAAAYEVRLAYFGNKVHLYYLMNIKSGLCPEDCHYCSQSKLSKVPIEKYPLLSHDEIEAGAVRAAENKAS